MIEILLATVFAQQEEPRIPTWKQDVHEIILSNCMPCHSSGGAGAFHLLRYEDVAGRASFIVELTRNGVMPPWTVDDSGLSVHHKRGISKEEIETIQRWIDAGKPEGDGAEIAICGGGLVIPDATAHTNPDTPWIIPAESAARWHKGIRDKRTFVLPVNNPNPMKVTSLKCSTTAPRAVQMVCFVFDHQGRARMFDGWDPDEPGYEMMGDIGWVPSGTHGKIGPGSGVVSLPHGFHWEVPPNIDFVAETHFRPTGKIEQLSLSVDLFEDAIEGSRAVQEIVSMIRRVVIEADDDAFVATEHLDIPFAVDVIGITPRAGAECSGMTISSTNSEGTKQLLLSYSDWDPHYGETVFFKKPFRVMKGDTITSVWNFNNSDSNPRNPFVPAQFIDLARKTGVANFVLHVAPVQVEQASDLYEWNLSMLRKRQRAVQ